jgi:3-oxoacyl-[acyl-carrier protein] reductase
LSGSEERRVVIVTGGSRGIGAAVCRSFARAGDIVVINYSSSGKDAEALKKELLLLNDTINIAKADVSDYKQVKPMIDSVVEEYGKIDVLVNNAGITRDGFIMLMSGEDWNDVININLTGMFNCSKAVSEYMMSRRSGAIVNMSSLSGITGLPGQTNYSAAKGGVIAFTKSLAKELARFGIRVNAVAPGVIETGMIDSLKPEIRERYLENIPVKRFGSPDEVASVVKFLASQDASYVTGETIGVTGGLH